jgi:hypothetical protein
MIYRNRKYAKACLYQHFQLLSRQLQETVVFRSKANTFHVKRFSLINYMQESDAENKLHGLA